MKSWSYFLITLGTLSIATYPYNYKPINLIMGAFLIVSGFIMSRRKK